MCVYRNTIIGICQLVGDGEKRTVNDSCVDKYQIPFFDGSFSEANFPTVA